MMSEVRLIIDVACKYVVLFAFTAYIGVLVWTNRSAGEIPNLPDWMVMLFTIVVQYFFRRSPKQNGGSS